MGMCGFLTAISALAECHGFSAIIAGGCAGGYVVGVGIIFYPIGIAAVLRDSVILLKVSILAFSLQ